jgi:hypothetical protein
MKVDQSLFCHLGPGWARDQWYDLPINIFAKNCLKNDVFDSKQSQIMQKFGHSIGFWGKGQLFSEKCRKSQKIEIITSTPDWANIGWIFSSGRFQRIKKEPKILGYFFHGKKSCNNLLQRNGLIYTLFDFFPSSSGHPGASHIFYQLYTQILGIFFESLSLKTEILVAMTHGFCECTCM